MPSTVAIPGVKGWPAENRAVPLTSQFRASERIHGPIPNARVGMRHVKFSASTWSRS
jgi:hypothetical protein